MTAMSFWWQKLMSSALAKYGCTSTWFMAGLILPFVSMFSSFNNIESYMTTGILYIKHLNPATFDVIWEQNCVPVEVT